jgi:hypothetical protein
MLGDQKTGGGIGQRQRHGASPLREGSGHGAQGRSENPSRGKVGAPRLARLEPYRPRYRAGVGTLVRFHQVALREPTEVPGPIEIHLRVATAAVDTDFTAKPIDVYPPSAWCPQGYALKPHGQRRAAPLPQRPRAGGAGEAGRAGAGDAHALSDEQPVHAGAPAPAGRIELDFPRFDVNPNTERRSGGSGGGW